MNFPQSQNSDIPRHIRLFIRIEIVGHKASILSITNIRFFVLQFRLISFVEGKTLKDFEIEDKLLIQVGDLAATVCKALEVSLSFCQYS